MTAKQLVKHLRIVKFFTYKQNGISWALQSGNFYILANPLTWLLFLAVVPVVLILGGITGFSHIPKSIRDEKRDRQAYKVAKEKGWLI